MGILLLGTANDLAMACNILLALEPALQLAIKGCSVPIDLAKVNNERYSINMATGVFGIHITTEMPEKLKAAFGSFSYFIHGLLLRMDRLQTDRFEIHGPDFHCSGEALVIGIGNGKQDGGGQSLYLDVLINDSLLQPRLLIADEPLPALVAALLNDEESKNIISSALPWLEIRVPHEIIFNLDGEEPLVASIFTLSCYRKPSNAAYHLTAPPTGLIDKHRQEWRQCRKESLAWLMQMAFPLNRVYCFF